MEEDGDTYEDHFPTLEALINLRATEQFEALTENRGVNPSLRRRAEEVV